MKTKTYEQMYILITISSTKWAVILEEHFLDEVEAQRGHARYIFIYSKT